jgi:hypothetical protein
MIPAEARKKTDEPACLVVKNEEEFFTYIEGRLRDEGFELLETSPGAGWSQCPSAKAY